MSRFIVRLSYLFLFYFLTISASLGASYSLEFSGPSTINAGANFSIEVYLKETLGTGEATKLGDPTDGGLVIGNFRVQISPAVSYLTKVTGNVAFDTYGGDALTDPWMIEQSDLIVADGVPTGTPDGPDVYKLLLGTIYGLSASVGETFTLQLVDANPGADDLVLFDPINDIVLDTLVFLPTLEYTVTVSGAPPIPEPSMCLMFGSAVLLPCARALWGRRKSA